MTRGQRQEAGQRLEELRKDSKGLKKNMISLPLLAGPVTANLDTKFELALLGEHGEEETHATVNTLKRRARGLKCEEDRLKVLMSEHLATVSPHLPSVHPCPKKK